MIPLFSSAWLIRLLIRIAQTSANTQDTSTLSGKENYMSETLDLYCKCIYILNLLPINPDYALEKI